jgi:hypothetical protein
MVQIVMVTITLSITQTIVKANYNHVIANRVNIGGSEGKMICPDSRTSFDFHDRFEATC